MNYFEIVEIGLWYNALVAMDLAREFSTNVLWTDNMGFFTQSASPHPPVIENVDIETYMDEII